MPGDLDSTNVPEEKIVSAALAAMNRTGYPLQYAALQRARELFDADRSQWAFEVAEFPVALRGKPVHIDFVLRHKDRPNVYLVVECKRVDPAFAWWCFFRVPFRSRFSGTEGFIPETLKRMTATGTLQTIKARFGDLPGGPFSVALEIKTDRDGDGTGGGPSSMSNDRNINAAVTQVLRGVGGLADAFASNRSMSKGIDTISFIPVVLTTAELWTSETQLESAALETGHLGKGSMKLEKKVFLGYQYAASPDLRPEHPVRPASSDLSELLAAEYLRTVCIVNVHGLESFLETMSNLLG